MNTKPQQIISNAREEFKRVIRNNKVFIDLPNGGFEEGTEIILSWHSATLQAFIGAEIVRGNSIIPTRDTKITIDTGGKDIRNTSPKSLVAMGYAQALQDQISHLKELLETLKR